MGLKFYGLLLQLAPQLSDDITCLNGLIKPCLECQPGLFYQHTKSITEFFTPTILAPDKEGCEFVSVYHVVAAGRLANDLRWQPDDI
jgi:hypothetical protein